MHSIVEVERQSNVENANRSLPSVFLFILFGSTLVYTTIVLLFVLSTQRQLTKYQAAQQSTVNKLVTHQLQIETQMNSSTAALARRLGMDEHDFQHELDAKSANLHRQQRELARSFESQTEQHQQEIGQVNTDVANMRTELGGAKTDIAATRTELASTNSKLEHAIGDLNGQSHLIARTREELDELRHRGDRSYYEFALTKGAAPTPVSTVSLQLKKVDPKKNKFSLNVVADDLKVEKKDRSVAEPLQFYTGRDRQLYEVVIWTTEKKKVTGYLSTPKTTTVIAVGQRP